MAMNIINQVTQLAMDMIARAEANDIAGFEKLYKELQSLCSQNAGTANDHPVQWETLADFTQDVDEAIELYKKALAVSEKLKAHQYSASIHYALADNYSDLDNRKAAVDHARKAKALADKYDDEELKQEIDALLGFLSE